MIKAESIVKLAQDNNCVGEVIRLIKDSAVVGFEHKEGPIGPIYFRPMKLEEAGVTVVGHQHNYDHVTILYVGKINVLSADDKDFKKNVTERQYKAPSEILIPAKRFHRITSLEPSLVKCAYPHRDYEGNIIESYIGNRMAVI